MRRGSEANSGQASVGGEDDEQVDAGETDGERNAVRDHAPVEREVGGGLGEVRLPMEDHSVEEGEGEDVVDEELQRRFFVRRIGPTVLAQMLVTVAVVVAVNYGLESFLRANVKVTFACQILAVALVCASCVCCALRLGTTWPLGIIYLAVPCVSFGVLFGTLSVAFADEASFLVATAFSCGFLVVANILFIYYFLFSSGKYLVNPNGWLFSFGPKFGHASLPEDWATVALSIYMDFALISVLSLLLLGKRHQEDSA